MALVDEEASVELARDDGGDDFVKRDDDGFDVWVEELEGEVCGGEGAGDGDAEFLDLVKRVLARGPGNLLSKSKTRQSACFAVHPGRTESSVRKRRPG